MEVFGSSGTRGVVPEELSPSFVLRVAAVATDHWAADRVAIGRDTRKTGPMLAAAASSGVAAAGADVDRIGVVPTPAAQQYAEAAGIPALVITASHNPPPYNGIKLVGADGVELDRATLETIDSALAATREPPATDWHAVGDVRSIEGVADDYRAAVVDAVDRDRIAEAAPTVAIDPGHGAGAVTSPTLFRDLGCRVLTVNAQPDGRFPGRNPEPVRENLGDLRTLVAAGDADLGIAHDGDADRAIFVDETGEHVEGDAAFAALAAEELTAGDAVVTAVNVSQRLVDVVESVGARLELTPIGSTHIISRIEELTTTGTAVPIAGEGNGGIFFPTYRVARDGAYTAARFLELVAEQPASELLAPYEGYANERRNIAYESASEREAMLTAASEAAAESDAKITTRDGYRFDYGDAWLLVRPSGTEPLVRVYAEAAESTRAIDLAEEMTETLTAAATDG